MRRAGTSLAALLLLFTAACGPSQDQGKGSEGSPSSLSAPGRVNFGSPGGNCPGGSCPPSAPESPVVQAGYTARGAAPEDIAPPAVNGRPTGSFSAGGKTFGLIVDGDDGDTASTHMTNVELGARALSAHYRIAAQDLVVLEPRRTPASRANLSRSAAWLSTTVGPTDQVVIYTTGHGADMGGDTALALAGGEFVTSSELTGALDRIQAARLVYIGDQCHSGGAAASVARLGRAGREVIALSSTDSRHSTVCETFIRPFFQALQDPSVSERRAFDYAKAQHQQALGASGMTDSQFYVTGTPPVPRSMPTSSLMAALHSPW